MVYNFETGLGVLIYGITLIGFAWKTHIFYKSSKARETWFSKHIFRISLFVTLEFFIVFLTKLLSFMEILSYVCEYRNIVYFLIRGAIAYTVFNFIWDVYHKKRRKNCKLC